MFCLGIAGDSDIMFVWEFSASTIDLFSEVWEAWAWSGGENPGLSGPNVSSGSDPNLLGSSGILNKWLSLSRSFRGLMSFLYNKARSLWIALKNKII